MASLERVAQLLQLSEEEAEDALAKACVEGMLWLRMDRVKRTVSFKKTEPAEKVLTNWTGFGERGELGVEDVKEVMDELDKIVYLIEKEKMIKEVKQWLVCWKLVLMENGRRNGFVNTLSEYSILDIIGKGTYGEVYKAIHITTGDVVALKKVDSECGTS